MGDEHGPAVSASTGVMNALLIKLTSLINDKNPNIKEALKDVMLLKTDLTDMRAILLKSTVRDDPDVQVKEWMRQFREVLFEAEDYIDDLCTPQAQPAAGEEAPASDNPTATEKKGGSSSKGLFSWKPLGGKKSDVAARIKELRARIKDAKQRRLDYNLNIVEAAASDPAAIAGGSSAAFDPRQLKLEADDEEDDRPVGMDGPRDHLVDMLKDVEQEKQVKVVSIVGMGGLGKTTLAKEACRTLPVRFDCRAFVKVGRNAPIKTILLSILRQVIRGRQDQVDVGTSLNEQQAIDMLRGFLANKRYLVVVDDIWSISAWKIIKCALPESNSGSRVITTTRLNLVADACSSRPFIHVMVPLRESEAEKLFLSRISCPREIYESELKNILLKACSGVPLAMVTIAGMLRRKFSELLSWEKVRSYAISAWEHYSDLQGMMTKILLVSYSDLSLPLKTCLLYLSCFPENHTIKKDRLIWRWIAEGFIPVTAEGMWTTGEAYFYELVNRRLIQEEISDDDDEPVGCTIHGVVLDFIVSTSMEENFVTSETGMWLVPRDVIRRFSLSCNDQEDVGNLVLESKKNLYLSKVRSLTVFGGAGWVMDLVKNMQFLRMLDLQDAIMLADDHLSGIERLVHLKYMGLGGEGVKRLPEEIGSLQELETLDVRRTSVQELPASIVRLPKLARLLANDLPLPDGMEDMISLQEVHMVKLSPENVEKLTRMKRLRTLGLNWCFDRVTGGGSTDEDGVFAERLVSSLSELGNSKLESLLLHVYGGTHRSLHVMAESWDPPYLLRRFLMTTSSNYHLPRVPPKMKKLDLLAHLKISIDQLGVQDLQLLGSLPFMVILKLQTRVSVPTTITDEMFQRLKKFCFMCNDGGLGFVLAKGAMAKLQHLHLSFKARVQMTEPVGINYLTSLRRVQATIDCEGAICSDIKFAEEAITRQVSEHRGKPTLELIRDHQASD